MKSGRQFSLRGRYALLGAGAIAVCFLLQLAANSILLRPYYMHQMQRLLEDSFETICADTGGGAAAFSDIERQNISVTLFDAAGGVLYSSRSDHRDSARIVRQIYAEVTEELAQTDEDYFIALRAPETTTASGVLFSPGPTMQLGGRVDEQFVELSIKLEPIEMSTAITLRFTAAVGLCAMLLIILVFYCVTGTVTRPIEQMTQTAQRLARRDFSQRCDDRCRNEIGTLARSINSMSDQLRQYTEELQSANEQLKEDIAAIERANQARKDLVANLSHDLKTPVALISGYADGLASGVARTPEQMREYCDVIIDETARMQQMIQRMLELSRIESGSVTLNCEVFCLSELLDDLLALFREQIDHAGVTLERDYPAGLHVRSDYLCVEQVLTNYIQNAAQHADGEKMMSVSVERREQTGRLRVRIFNSCPPISPEEQGRLWDSFYRGERSRRRTGDQSGLGLAIVKGNMELLGEGYGFENVPGGVVFWMELPEGKS